MEAVSGCWEQESLMHLLIAAAGSGRRMGATRNKLLLPLSGQPVLAWTLQAALAAETIHWIGIIGQEIDRSEILDLVGGAPKPVVWIAGGDSRQESVERGLAGLPTAAKHVLIHDGARCLATPDLFNRCAEAVRGGQAVIAATPVTDTIKKVDESGLITATPNRAELWAAQTPQAFSVDELRQGHREARANGWTVTDDASLYERLGWPVNVLDAGPSNIKVTTPFDLTVAAAVLAERQG
ncbi:2-C-methyl-D-erythritol 4-phosphate cytidylyltransferase [Synechococcus sp. WH 8016]|jgi:2-C-methyl-D-erythritol 4-phosphate cytidylyltransferase|nr:2-C-methyl-D-erythritol 4-phosphate cytidylyltransferase [Synechococcus sp. WH 8016]